MPTVLIVDDEQHIRLLIEQTLEELEDDDVVLLTAPDGEVALDVVANQHPDLVFLDVTMPKRNGFEVCRAIKADPATAGTTVFLLTAKGQAYDREAGFAAGADDYLTKPFDPDDLLRAGPSGPRPGRGLTDDGVRGAPPARHPPSARRADAVGAPGGDRCPGHDLRPRRRGDPRPPGRRRATRCAGRTPSRSPSRG